jgi:hypothetical protein
LWDCPMNYDCVYQEVERRQRKPMKKPFVEDTVDALIRITPGAGAKENKGCGWKIVSAIVLVLAAGLAKAAGGNGLVMKVYPSVLAFFGTIAVCQALGIFFSISPKSRALPFILATIIFYGVLSGAACLLWRISSGDPFSLDN